MNVASLFLCAVSSLTVLTLQAAISALVTKATSETAHIARVRTARRPIAVRPSVCLSVTTTSPLSDKHSLSYLPGSTKV